MLDDVEVGRKGDVQTVQVEVDGGPGGGRAAGVAVAVEERLRAANAYTSSTSSRPYR